MSENKLVRAFLLHRVIMWELSLYCCVSHRCCTAEQRLITTLTITTSAAMSVLRAFVMVGGTSQFRQIFKQFFSLVKFGGFPLGGKNPQIVFDNLPCERAIIYTILGYIILNTKKNSNIRNFFISLGMRLRRNISQPLNKIVLVWL